MYIFIIPITNWSLIVTTVSLIHTIWATQNQKHFASNWYLKRETNAVKLTFNHQARQHLLYQFSFLLNFMVVFVWWTYLYEGFISKHRDLPNVGKGREFYLKSVHIVPPLVNLFNTLSLNSKLQLTFWKTVVLVILAYCTYSYL